MIASSHILTPDTRPIDWRQPINWADPLNDGLVSWWMAIPNHTAGTSTWRDLCGRNDGTLTNFSSVDTAWKTRSQDGGLGGALEFDGGSRSVEAADNSSPVSTDSVSACAWVWITASDSVWNYVVSQMQSAHSTFRWNLSFSTALKLHFNVFDSTATGSGQPVNGATVMTASRWHHVAAVFDNTAQTVAVYLDAVADGSASASGGMCATAGVPYRLGKLSFSTAQTLNGLLADVRCWDRALTADEIQSYYDLSRRYYPGLLNRPSRRSVFAPSTGTTITPATLSISAALQGSPPVSSRTIEVT